MLIRLTATAMLALFVTTSLPTASYAGTAKCQSLLREMQRTLATRKAVGTMSRLEEILEDMEDECDLNTFFNAASKVGKVGKYLNKLKD
jgi:hypothetical protein